MFRGNAMTYYGRWTYKYEIASEKGAAAAIIVHETGPAGYPYEVVSGSWGRENFDIKRPDGNAGRIAVESWVGLDTAKRLLSLAGQDFDALKKSALSKDFKPVPLGVRANFVVRNKLRDVQSRNVVARLEGSDPGRKDEYVIYTAHWDHLGKDEKLQGDQIYNGALDNASGTAALLELAEAFTKLKTPPKRSILFLSLTAEEKGLLGAEYYVENPLYPLGKTVANINMDGINPWGRTRDIVVIGLGNSTLDDVLTEAARLQGRTVKPDAEPEKGSFYRSDHFEFAKQGVPALYTDSGTEYIGKPAEFGKQKRDEYTEKDYHKVSDEIKPDWELSGAVEDLQLLFQAGYRVAQEEMFPVWKPGTEFKEKREQMLRKPSN
ncbi:MAG: peptidase M28, partial [Acidobacteria bacterium]